MDEVKTPGDNSGRRHETRDASIRSLTVFAVGLFVVLAMTLLAMRGVFDYFVRRQGLGPPASPLKEADVRTLPPAGQPRLQVTPAQDLKQYRETQDAVLNSYGWVDQKAGIVRIPIDRAMDLLLERGLPIRTSAQGRPQERIAARRASGGGLNRAAQERVTLAAASSKSRNPK